MTQIEKSPDADRYAPRTFTVADPRTFEGDPYEVAERAVRQAAAVAAVLAHLLDATEKMARNAEMERAFANHEQPKGSEWPNTPQGIRFAAVSDCVDSVQKSLGVLAVAAGFNPKAPLPKE